MVQRGQACLAEEGVLEIHITAYKVIYLTLYMVSSARRELSGGKTIQQALDELL